MEIDAALSPVLGRHAVALLYQRSVHLAGRPHPWLAGICEDGQAAVTEALRQAFARQDSATAAAGGYELLQAFHGMLASLVGVPLAERLLRFVCASDDADAPEPLVLARLELANRGLAS